MASLLHSGPASAFRTQVVALRVSPAQSMASMAASSSFSTLCPQARLQASLRSQSSLPTLSIRQSRTFLTQLRRQAQALKEHTTSASASPTPVKPAKKPSPPLQLTNLPYFVRRTASNQLPVYVDTKAGGNKQLTKVQKTEGDLDALRNDLAVALNVSDVRGKPNPDVTLNRLTGHIIVKGWRKPEIVEFLKERGF
ncbi:Mitochondrial large ribosomal subunit L49 [Penicillium brevicompactum]|uniref:Large ribosomal subunit protein mL49 n=1 Tax=Penicillium brevicompactum TaxID=5074 RepID=A0A9W9UK03_PENBR|nr:Mitochondrial large ribosomal subunit L49 [Penicillium brevicompactum]